MVIKQYLADFPGILKIGLLIRKFVEDMDFKQNV